MSEFEPTGVKDEPKQGSAESKRSRVCAICNGETETYHLNYGVSSCFSCRAFFRRVVQKGSSEKLKCKGNKECQLISDSQKKCRRCRFQRCLESGMKEDSVLREDEKKSRFRKHFVKQLEEEVDITSLASSVQSPVSKRKKLCLNSVPEEIVTKTKLKFKRKKKSAGDPDATSVLLTPSSAASTAMPASVGSTSETDGMGSALQATPPSSSRDGSSTSTRPLSNVSDPEKFLRFVRRVSSVPQTTHEEGQASQGRPVDFHQSQPSPATFDSNRSKPNTSQVNDVFSQTTTSAVASSESSPITESQFDQPIPLSKVQSGLLNRYSLLSGLQNHKDEGQPEEKEVRDKEDGNKFGGYQRPVARNTYSGDEVFVGGGGGGVSVPQGPSSWLEQPQQQRQEQRDSLFLEKEQLMQELKLRRKKSASLPFADGQGIGPWVRECHGSEEPRWQGGSPSETAPFESAAQPRRNSNNSSSSRMQLAMGYLQESDRQPRASRLLTHQGVEDLSGDASQLKQLQQAQNQQASLFKSEASFRVRPHSELLRSTVLRQTEEEEAGVGAYDVEAGPLSSPSPSRRSFSSWQSDQPSAAPFPAHDKPPHREVGRSQGREERTHPSVLLDPIGVQWGRGLPAQTEQLLGPHPGEAKQLLMQKFLNQSQLSVGRGETQPQMQRQQESPSSSQKMGPHTEGASQLQMQGLWHQHQQLQEEQLQGGQRQDIPPQHQHQRQQLQPWQLQLQQEQQQKLQQQQRQQQQQKLQEQQRQKGLQQVQKPTQTGQVAPPGIGSYIAQQQQDLLQRQQEELMRQQEELQRQLLINTMQQQQIYSKLNVKKHPHDRQLTLGDATKTAQQLQHQMVLGSPPLANPPPLHRIDWSGSSSDGRSGSSLSWSHQSCGSREKSGGGPATSWSQQQRRHRHSTSMGQASYMQQNSTGMLDLEEGKALAIERREPATAATAYHSHAYQKRSWRNATSQQSASSNYQPQPQLPARMDAYLPEPQQSCQGNTSHLNLGSVGNFYPPRRDERADVPSAASTITSGAYIGDRFVQPRTCPAVVDCERQKYPTPPVFGQLLGSSGGVGWRPEADETQYRDSPSPLNLVSPSSSGIHDMDDWGVQQQQQSEPWQRSSVVASVARVTRRTMAKSSRREEMEDPSDVTEAKRNLQETKRSSAEANGAAAATKEDGDIDFMTSWYDNYLMDSSFSSCSGWSQTKDLKDFARCLQMNPRLGIMKKKLLQFYHLVKTWGIAVERMKFKPELVDGIMSMHLVDTPLEKDMLREYALAMSILLRDFASQQPEFRVLDIKEQKKCLLQGAQKLIQYFLGQYLASGTGGDQVQWIMAFHPAPFITDLMLNSCSHLTVDAFNDMVKLFPTGLKYSLFCSHIQEFISLGVPPWCNGLIAAMFLFQGRGCQSPPDYANFTVNLEVLLMGCANTPHDNESITKKIKGVCSSMSRLFEAQLDETVNEDMPLESILSEACLRFTMGEDSWINHQRSLVKTAFSQVNFGGDLTKDYIFHSLDSPISGPFIKATASVFQERLKRVLLEIPEFHCLSAQDQGIMLKANVMDAFAAYVAYLECSQNGEEQIPLIFGQEDLKLYHSEFEKVISLKNVKPVNMAAISGGQVVNISYDTYLSYVKSSNNIGRFLKDMDRFQDFLLLALLSNDHVQNATIEMTRRRFFTAIQRKFVDEHGVNASMMMETWANVWRDVKSNSALIANFFAHIIL